MRKLFLILVTFIFISQFSIAQEQPNIVVFLVDDLRTELGCYGNDLVKSPNIDALAKDGVQFQKAYAQQAICAPSRMSILSGMRPESIGIYSLFTPFRSVHKDKITMPQFFKQNGYKTIGLGKVYHNANDDVDSWSIHFPNKAENWIKPENIALMDSLKKAGNKQNGPAFECIEVKDEAYKDGSTTAKAIEILNEVKNDKFLMFVGLTKPHLPFTVPKKYWDLYNVNNFKVPAKIAPKDAYRLALTNWGELRNYHGIPQEGDLNDDLTKKLIHGYYASVSYIDAQIGKVMQELDKLDLRKNTIVVLMSDHGWKLGEYGAWCKHTNFEIDVNVPLIISRQTNFKNRVTNANSNALVENVDLFATMAEACGLKVSGIQSKSILPLVDNPKKEWSNAAYSLYPRGKKTMGFTCTNGEYRYTEWWDNEGQKLIESELYLCEQDYSKQTVNLAKEAKYKNEILKLAKLLEVQFPIKDRSLYPQNDK